MNRRIQFVVNMTLGELYRGMGVDGFWEHVEDYARESNLIGEHEILCDTSAEPLAVNDGRVVIHFTGRVEVAA